MMKSFKELLESIPTESFIESDSNLLYEGEFSDTRKELLASGETKNSADKLARAASEDVNHFVLKHNKSLADGHKGHNLTHMRLATQAYMGHFIAGHAEPIDSPLRKVHFDAAKTQWDAAETAKEHLHK